MNTAFANLLAQKLNIKTNLEIKNDDERSKIIQQYIKIRITKKKKAKLELIVSMDEH